jgi:pilus assembly protein CpaB
MKFNLNNRFKPNKTWIILGVALAIGVLAALAARSYLSSQMDAIEARGKGKTVNLIVASKAMQRGEKISTSNVAVRAIPLDYAHSSAVAPEGYSRLDGQPLAFDVRPGELILWGMIEGKKGPTFSSRVAVGRRAMTVPVDEINSISGMLEPGDQIDLIVTIEHKGKKRTLPLLQSVQVMATGQRSVDGSKEGERKQYSTVTINTTPEQAQNVIIARDVGKVTALLRNPEDKRQIAGGEADMAVLLGKADLTSGDRTVPVLYGGSAKLSPEALTMGSRTVAPAPPAVAPALRDLRDALPNAPRAALTDATPVAAH